MMESPAMGAPIDPYAPQPIDPYVDAPIDPYAAQGMQPGIGIPADMLEQAMPAPMQMPAMQPGIGIPAHMFGDLPPEMFADQQPEPMGADPWAPVEAPPPMGAPDDPYAWHGDPLENPDQNELNAHVASMARNDPRAFAAFEELQRQTAEHDAATAALEASAANRKRAEENHATYVSNQQATAQKMAALDAQVVEIMNRKIDPDRWWNSRSTGQKLSAFMGVIASGIAGGQAGNNSGRNAVLEDITHTIDQDIAAQKFDIENAQQGVGVRRGLVAQEYARTGDMHQAVEAVRIASLESVRGELLAQAQLRNPRNMQAIGIAKAVTQVEAQIAASRAAAEAAEFKRRMDLSEQMRKWADTEEERRKNLASEAAAAAKLAAKGGGVGKQKARPVTPVYTEWLHKKGIGDGPQARAAFEEHRTNVLREQGAWDKTGGRAGGSAGAAAPPVSFAAPGARSTALPAATAPESVAAPTEKAEATKYESKADWFEKNRPGLPPAERKNYLFLDGKNGNETPPLELEIGVDPEKFIERQRLRKEMSVKADQLRVLTERMNDRGAWTTAKNSFNWTSDDDAKEARALWQDLVGLAITAKGMGVPSGNDVERVYQMVGGDPAGWIKNLPELNRARESMQLEQDADFKSAAPSAADDPVYNRYRVLPLASKDWIEKVRRRGEAKILRPEYGGNDPKQLDKLTIDVVGDAPDLARAARNEAFSKNAAAASEYLEATGASESLAADMGAAALGVTGVSRPRPVPQIEDFVYSGKPGGATAFEKLRKQYVSGIVNAKQYIASRDDADWKAFKESQQLALKALKGVVGGNPELLRRYIDKYAPGAPLTTWDQNPGLVARMTGEILRTGAK